MTKEGSGTYLINALKIKSMMGIRNLSMAELARLTGINARTIRNILQKKHAPREDTLAKIAGALGVKWPTLLEEHQGEPEEIESEGMPVKTTTQIILAVPNGTVLEAFLELLRKKLQTRHINASDIISITILRDDDEN